jgi:hypothetical protein
MYRPNVLAVWVYILCHVEWRATDAVFEGQRITLQPGQGIFKLRELARELRVPRSSLFRVIDVLKTEKQIGTQTSPRNTLITVVNWKKYQLVGTANRTQTGHKRDTNGTQTGHLPIIKEKEEREESISNNNYSDSNILQPVDNPVDNFDEDAHDARIFFQERICPIRNLQENVRLEAMVNTYGLGAFKEAVSVAKQHGGHSLQYVEKVLQNTRNRRGVKFEDVADEAF